MRTRIFNGREAGAESASSCSGSMEVIRCRRLSRCRWRDWPASSSAQAASSPQGQKERKEVRLQTAVGVMATKQTHGLTPVMRMRQIYVECNIMGGSGNLQGPCEDCSDPVTYKWATEPHCPPQASSTSTRCVCDI